jgi:hypothetical protein
MKLKTVRDNGTIMLQLNGNTVACLWEYRAYGKRFYENDTFSSTHSTIKRAKIFFENKIQEGYYGEQMKQWLNN